MFVITVNNVEELYAKSSLYDAVSINYSPDNVNRMIDLLKGFDFDSNQFHRPDLTLAHARKAAVFGYGDDKPLLITVSETESAEDKIFMMNEVLNIADCERAKRLCVLQFIDMSAQELARDLKNCFRVLRQSKYWTKIENIDVYVSSQNYVLAREIYEDLMRGW